MLYRKFQPLIESYLKSDSNKAQGDQRKRLSWQQAIVAETDVFDMLAYSVSG